MMQISGISKNFGTQTLFDNATFVVNSRERIGLVGSNGTGKSTLLRLIMGEESVDGGSISFPKGYKVGRLSQHLEFHEPTVLAEACLGLPADERDQVYRAEIILSGLGFSDQDMQRPASEFSGGFQIRVNLARLLLSEPNLLLLDEPTNYLDIVSARWLATTLREWKNELIVITHDRTFMDSVTTHTVMIYRANFRKIAGPTAKLFEAIAVDEEVYEKTRINDQKKRKEVEQFIARFRAQASKATLVQSRVKALERMTVKEELSDEATLDFVFASKPFHGRTPLEVQDLTFGYGNDSPLVESLSFHVGKNDRIGIIGKNGRGKSTLLRLIAGELAPRSGSVTVAQNTSMSYFGQTNIDRLTPHLTIEEEISQAHPGMHRTRVRGICGTMMFEGDRALKKINVLSGGERSRVLLGRIIATPSNLLLLDEPTNHLDMNSVEALKDALRDYDGAVILVTHNEMLLRELCTRLVVFQGEAPFVLEGGYDYFLDKMGWDDEEADKPSKKQSKRTGAGQGAPKKTRMNAQQIEKIEKRIVKLEEEQKILQQELVVATDRRDATEATRLSIRIHEIGEAIEAAFLDLSEN